MPNYDGHPQTSGRAPADDDRLISEKAERATESYFTIVGTVGPVAAWLLTLMREGYLAGFRGGPEDGKPR